MARGQVIEDKHTRPMHRDCGLVSLKGLQVRGDTHLFQMVRDQADPVQVPVTTIDEENNALRHGRVLVPSRAHGKRQS